MRKCICAVFPFLLALHTFGQLPDTASIQVHLSQPTGRLKPIWAWFGYDEPNYTYMKDGKKLLTEIAAFSPVPVYVRTHSLLVSGDGSSALKWGSTNVYTEDTAGNPVYDWRIVDSIFDTYVQRGMKPLAQIGFMPEALSSHPQPYRHQWKPGTPYQEIITGWAYPPKDYTKWCNLAYEWVKHCVARYGQKEVESWYWEVWNEPDGYYWKGTREEFFKLYDYAADGVKRALPTARIGGCNSTGGAMKWLDAFIRHCLYDTNYATGKIGSPMEALLFHAKGSPKVTDGVVVMGIRNQLQNYYNNLKVIQAYPQLKALPIIVGESDPEGCAACGMATDPQNAYRNGTMYSSYTAASLAREYELAENFNANLIGAVNWSFEFEDQPWFYGFRDLATNGVDKPVLNIFRMLGKMTGDKVKATSSRQYPLTLVLDSGVRRQKTDVGVLASTDKKSAAVLIWNYHDADQKGDTAQISVGIDGINAKQIKLTHYRIDDTHSNSYETWKRQGSPQQPTAAQIAELEKAGQLQLFQQPKTLSVRAGQLQTQVELPRQGVSLLLLKW